MKIEYHKPISHLLASDRGKLVVMYGRDDECLSSARTL
jgi:hypothetical protein